MCRHLGYLGPSRPLRSLVLDPPHSLRAQALAPRLQRPGSTNLDGWGVGWWPVPGAEPERHRTTTPLPEDPHLVDTDIEAPAALAAARLASPGSTIDETGNAPFAAGRWLFSLNGYVAGFHQGVGDQLGALLTPARRGRLEGDTDSEVLFGLFLDAIDAGADPGDALEALMARVLSMAEGRLNLLLGDGERLWATVWRHSLFALVDGGLAEGGVLVASEPLDDHPGWQELPGGSLVAASRDGVESRALRGHEGVA